MKARLIFLCAQTRKVKLKNTGVYRCRTDERYTRDKIRQTGKDMDRSEDFSLNYRDSRTGPDLFMCAWIRPG